MDILTQGLLGAALAQTAAPRDETRRAALIGGVAGLLADADILIRSSSDPLLTLEFHRHFSHALLFIPFGALIAALPLWWLLRHRLGFGRVYLYALLGYALSGVLDACTSYGTQLLWPLSDARIAWNLIAVVDPLFTLALAVGVIGGCLRRSPWWPRVALLVAAAYLGLAGLQQQRATAVASELAASRGHPVERLLVKPTLGNLLLWRVIYESGGRFHVAAVWVGPGAAVIHPGSSLPRLRVEPDLAALPDDSVALADAKRFAHFSDNWLALHPNHADVIGDIRYSMMPDGLVPLWGIRIDSDRPQQHVDFATFRSSSSADRQRLWAMLKGLSPDPVTEASAATQ